MTTAEFRKTIKEQLDKCDAGKVIMIARNGKIYQIKRVTND